MKAECWEMTILFRCPLLPWSSFTMVRRSACRQQLASPITSCQWNCPLDRSNLWAVENILDHLRIFQRPRKCVDHVGHLSWFLISVVPASKCALRQLLMPHSRNKSGLRICKALGSGFSKYCLLFPKIPIGGLLSS